jgi:elongation factor 1-alpha
MSSNLNNIDGNDTKKHVSVVICGHVDSGKSSLCGSLLYKLGGINDREMKKLEDEADRLGKSSFAYAFYMDKQVEERARGITITCATKEFFTPSKHYTIIDAPGHRDFIKNMISGASQADVALLLVPADGNFIAAIQKGDHKAGEVEGQTRQHALLINLLGVKQLIVGINKMDASIAGYSEKRYNEVKDEIVSMLTRVGWKKDFIKKSIPIIPMSGLKSENILKESDKMSWWKGVDLVTQSNKKVHIHTLHDALENFVEIPARPVEKVVRAPISGVYKITGAGDVLTSRVESGTLKPGQEVKFLPTHTSSNPCTGRIFKLEMHHKEVLSAKPGDNVGMNIKGLAKNHMPRVGDIMVPRNDESINICKSMTVQVKVLTHPGELKVGYTPIGFVRTSRTALRMTKINWKIGKDTGNQKIEDPLFIKSNEMAELVFEPEQPFVVETFDQCEGLSRIAILEGATVVMLGKVVKVEHELGKGVKVVS